MVLSVVTATVEAEEALPVRAPTNAVDVTEANPAIVVALAPRLIVVVPIVIVELARLAFDIPAEPESALLVKPVIVFAPAEILLFESVCVPVNVTASLIP